MRKATVFTSVVLGILLLGAAQTAGNPIDWPPSGPINLYADYAGTVRYISTPASGGTKRVYVFLNLVPEYPGTGTACRFSAPTPACFVAELVGETHYYPTVGDSQTGMTVTFGACLSPPVLLARLTYVYDGEEFPGATVCCFHWVLPDAQAPTGEIELVNCNGQTVIGGSGALIYNPDENDCMTTNPVESSTWGKVKALYVP